MLLRSIVSGVCLVAAASAYAGDRPNLERANLQQLQQKCAQFRANPQMKPVSVTVTCVEQFLEYRPIEALPAQLPTVRSIGAQVQMKNYQTTQQFRGVQSAPLRTTCPQFRQVERRVAPIDVEISCQQLESVNDLTQFCLPIIEKRLAEDPSAASYRNTGNVQKFCN